MLCVLCVALQKAVQHNPGSDNAGDATSVLFGQRKERKIRFFKRGKKAQETKDNDQ